MAHSILAASVIAVLVISVGVGAKRGCSAFGHSCYGGHGKRSDSTIHSSSELLGRQQAGQAETPSQSIYPQPYGILTAGDDIIPVRDGGAYDRDGIRAREAMKTKMRNILRYWMDYYRRSRSSEEGPYTFDAL